MKRPTVARALGRRCRDDLRPGYAPPSWSDPRAPPSGYHVSVATTYADLHELVDRLTPDQADAVRGVVRHLVYATGQGEPEEPPPVADLGAALRTSVERAQARVGGVDADTRVRRLSFAGALRSGKGDLAARSEDIIRAELGNAG